jgi:hypothetical protein
MANIVQWQDLFVIVDNGHVTVGEYERLEPLVRVQAKGCPDGLGCLVIIPDKADPPPSAVRHHLEGMLGRLPIRSLAYLVEGTGFRAATARAALIGLGIFQRTRYPTKVLTTLETALDFVLTGSKEVRVAMKVIQQARSGPDGNANPMAGQIPGRMSK